MNQLTNKKTNYSTIKIAIIVFVLIIFVVPFYESKITIIWQSQGEGQKYNVFNDILNKYAIFSENTKKLIKIDGFFDQEYSFWSKIKESPIAFQQVEVIEDENINNDQEQFKILADIIVKQEAFIKAYNFLQDAKEKKRLAEEKQLKELPVLLVDALRSKTGLDMSFLIKQSSPPIGKDNQIAKVQTNNIVVEKKQDVLVQTKVSIVQPVIQKTYSSSSLIVGDSFMAAGGGLGDVVEKGVLNYGDIKVNRYGVVSSGLSRPDYFDWNSKIRDLISKYNPKIVIVMFGANDNQSLTNKQGQVIARYGGQEWNEAYAKRVSDMLDIFKENNIDVFWVGLPVMREQWFSNNVADLNSIYENQCQQYQNAHFVSTWKILADDNGKYSAYLKNEQGKNELARIRDGVHLTYFGGSLITKEILKKIDEYLDPV